MEVGGRTRDLVDVGRSVQRGAARRVEREAAARAQVVTDHAALRDRALRRELAELPVETLRTPGSGRIPVEELHAAGLRTVLDLRHTGTADLDRVPGIGAATARTLRDAVLSVVETVSAGVRVRIERDDPLLSSLSRLVRLREGAAGLDPDGTAAALAPLLKAALPARNRVRWWVTPPARRAAAQDAVAQLGAWLDDARGRELLDRYLVEPVEQDDDPWPDFERRSPEYYAVLDEIVDLGLDVTAAQGHLPGDVAAAVREQPLDTSLLSVTLRPYQSFGARFVLLQRRVLLGDEMGLGKTVQALAVLAHLAARESGPALVVCPASVLVTWVREIENRTALAALEVYGPDRHDDHAEWRGSVAAGGRRMVAVTTFESLRDLPPPDGPIGALVVDEAHYVKNPEARRSRAVAAWAAAADRVLFMTGTPMENRVGEFRDLVTYLSPAVAERIDARYALVRPQVFRAQVAPVYLRRNASDVLTELPELVEAPEWVPFGPSERDAYRQALRRKRFGDMRRAAWTGGASVGKTARLVELVEEAGRNGLKTLVFSYFRAVVDAAVAALDDVAPVLGPLTGDTAPKDRQELVDAFTAHPGPAVLVSQIQAGGVGLNLQAASVVILCEPQVKPTLETQAVARAHRMGQVRTVQVHRLLTPDSVDERMLEILAGKTRLFDDYARISDLADSTPDATLADTPLADEDDATPAPAVLEREVIRRELEREGITPEAAPS